MASAPKSAIRSVEQTVAASLARLSIQRRDLLLIALSGGPDSVALLHLLLALKRRFGYRLAAAHLNHGLRGSESDRDEAFVRQLCAESDVELIAELADDLDRQMPNLEERARERRHAFLARVADQRGARFVALAHHADDQAETVMLRLLRGAGATGLAAMSPAGPGKLIRPMLTLTRAQIERYLAATGARSVNDSSNRSRALLRNRVRMDLLPALERDYSPGLARRLVDLASEMRDLDTLLASLADAELAGMLQADGNMNITKLGGLNPALVAAVLRRFITSRLGSLRGLTRAHVEAVRSLCLTGPANGKSSLPGGWRARREYRTLCIERARHASSSAFSMPVAIEGTTVVEPAAVAFEARLLRTGDVAMPADNSIALFDADSARGVLAVRNFHRGDRIHPLGIRGTVKVKDVFIDLKVPPSRRASFPVVTLDERIEWLPGLKRGSGALITPKTRWVLSLCARYLIAAG